MAWLRSVAFVDVPVFAVTFGVAVAGMVAIDWRVWMRTPWLALTFDEQRS
jgi:hypothetical protein